MNKTIFAIAAAACLASCSSTKRTTDSNANISIFNEWYIETIGGQAIKDGVNPFVALDQAASTYSGNAACNMMNGKFECDTDKGTISFSHAVTTRMYCPDMETETTVLNALGQVSAYSINNEGTMTFTNNDGTPVMTLVPKRDIDGRWLFDTVRGKKVRTTDNVPFLEIYSSKRRVHGNLGCNIYNATIPMDFSDNAISFANGQMTMMMCPDMETENSVRTALQEVKTFKLDGDTLSLLDSEGNTVLTLLRD